MKTLSAIALTRQSHATLHNDCAPIDSPHRHEDCAPIDAPAAAKPAVATAARLQLTPQLYTDDLPGGFTLAIGPYSPEGPVVLNRQALNRLRQFADPHPLTEAVDFTLAEAGLILPADHPPRLTIGRPHTLTAWLHVTNACNLDCPYCYIRKSSKRMSAEAGRAVVKAVFQTAKARGFGAVSLKYAGGEAPLHFQRIRQIHQAAKSLAAKTDITLHEVILTNGTVWTTGMARWVADNGLDMTLSLDGVGAAHDALRPTIGGGGSFDAIEHAIDGILLPAGLRPGVTITLTIRNAHAAADAVNWAIDRDLPFNLSIVRTAPTGLQPEEYRLIAGLEAAYRVIEERLPTRPFLDGLLDKVQMRAHAHTCGVNQSYLVFDHTGHRVAQCQMMLDRARPIESDGDLLSQVARGPIQSVSVDDKVDCRTCPWRYRCSGGCPVEAFRASGRFDAAGPQCALVKRLMPQALRLEGLRLLKLHGMLA